MAELNLKQITDKLNSEFAGDVRKLVFWYDANAEFTEDIDSLDLENAKILHLEKDNQFYVKYFLECVDRETNYLIYAPFAKPAVQDNHLWDTIRYSKEFFADRVSLIVLELGIHEKYRETVQRYNKFFAAKERLRRFSELDIEEYNSSTIEIGIMSALCKCRVASFEEVLRCILTDDGFEDNKYLVEFEKYDLLGAFWNHAESIFGYNDPKPTLEKFTITMFVTYAAKKVTAEIPQSLKPFVSYKAGNILAFIDNLMNSSIYGERFDEISDLIFETINGKDVFAALPVDSIVECGIFAGIDKIILDWLIKRLESEDTGAKLGDKTIPEICYNRRKMHFGAKFRGDYFIVENAYYIISEGKYTPVSGIDNIADNYINSSYKTDRRYRYFYYFYDNSDSQNDYENLRTLVENIYSNEYLDDITVNWNENFVESSGLTKYPLQSCFYDRYIKGSKDRVVVIISDALRYEVGQTLFEKFCEDEKCTASISAMQSMLPSKTSLGMAALLPHIELAVDNNFNVTLDGNACSNTEQREAILKQFVPNSKCIQFDSLKSMNQADLRAVFTGQEVVYIYHNQIDARGDKMNTENEVFVACEEAINEIHSTIRRISVNANTQHFIVTADHGFIYKRDKLVESDKINASDKGTIYGQRFALSENEITENGVSSIPFASVIGKDDNRMVYFPLGTDIFKVAGSGQNYVHGGSSPQEMIIPVIDVKVEKGHKETDTAKIALVSLVKKITNLTTNLDFVQTEPVSDIIKETTYRVYFVSAENEKISNENICVADKKDNDTTKRMFRLRFQFKNRKYDATKKYYLVAYDDKNDIEILRHEIMMDIAFADDFGFNI